MNPIEIKYKGKTYWGFKSPIPSWLRKLYIKWANERCMDCGSKEHLEIHRIKRGVEGGLYVVCPRNNPLHNTKVLCHKCHSKYNYSRKLDYSKSITPKLNKKYIKDNI